MAPRPWGVAGALVVEVVTEQLPLYARGAGQEPGRWPRLAPVWEGLSAVDYHAFG